MPAGMPGLMTAPHPSMNPHFETTASILRRRHQVVGAESAADFADIARAMVVPGSLARTQHQVTELAAEVIDGCYHAEIAVPERGTTFRVVARTTLAPLMDDATKPDDEGPGAKAMADGVCIVHDFEVDPRWPRLSDWASRHGVVSMCSIRLASDRQVHGVLNLYGVTPGAFKGAVGQRAAVFASHAALAL